MSNLKAKLKPYWFYIIVGTVAFVWMGFFDLNNLMVRFERSHQLSELEEDLRFYQNEKVAVQESRFILESDADELERFARERYKMKKRDETVFVIVDPETE